MIMNNHKFLKVVTDSFKKFLESGSHSNEKLKILHGAIAKDISDKLNRFSGFSKTSERFRVSSLGFGDGKESDIQGRYIDKKVDITIVNKANGVVSAGIAVKFVMQNYFQNSNNYFENMLGETANIRCKGIPYFQIFIIPDKIPYYKKDGKIEKWECFSIGNSHKYEILASDNPDCYFHTPNKMLLFVVHIPELGKRVSTKKDYVRSYFNRSGLMLKETAMPYNTLRCLQESSVIFNDYEKFIDKICHSVLAI